MRESTKSKLNAFSRLWAVSAGLFVILCIVAVAAVMSDRTNLMGIAVVGMCILFLAQLVQLVTAIMARRWWRVLGCVIGLAVSVFVLLSSIVALAAGQYRPPKFNEEEEVARETYSPDSALFTLEDEQVACRIAMVLPDEDVRPAVGEWLNEQMDGCYTGDENDIRSLVEFYGQYYADSLRHIYAEGVPEYAELSYDVSMDEAFLSAKVLTYTLTKTIDLGGAHPVTIETGATFSREDGQRLTWDNVFGEQKEKLRGEVKETLKEYFQVETDAELMENLQDIEDVADIPFPVNPPYMMRLGFAFVYQQYEIAAYAYGLPSGTIPYRVLKPYLTEWASQLMDEDYSFPVTFKGQEPGISDFVTAIVSQEACGEFLGRIGDEWRKYLKGQKYEGRFMPDSKHGYLRFEEHFKDDGDEEICITDFCFWNCSDGRHKIVAEASTCSVNGVPFDGQYSGLSIYVYDGKLRRMEMVPLHEFGLEQPDINSMLTYTLPVEGKDIIATANDEEKGECRFVYEWNGNGFTLQDQ